VYEYETVGELFTAICNAVRELEGSEELIPHQEIPERIKIPSNYGLVTFTAVVPTAAEIMIS
jgi:hypothetical protein